MKKQLALATAFSVIALGALSQQSVQAQALPAVPPNCQYLREVVTGQTSIRKVIATNNSNANTDFAVPTGVSFASYIAKMIPENNSRYQVDVNLKYNDGSSSTIVSRTIEAKRFFLYNQPFQPPLGRQPFQINTRVAGERNTAYRVFVAACR